MDNGFASPRDAFPAGLRVLVVDDDLAWLKILEKMLKKCSYEVTTCSLARDALEKLRERKDGFDIVISDVNMPDMDGFKLLEHVGLEMDLPVIMMSVDGETSRVMKGVQHGACNYLLKPIRMKELQIIWQHVFRKKIQEVKDIENHDDIQFMRNGSVEFDDEHLASGGDVLSLKKRKYMENKEHEDQEFNDPSAAKKARIVWSVDLHQKFVKAVNQIGIDKVGPKKILDLMNVPWLTRENIASHLQKYRLYLSRLQKQNEPKDSLSGIKQTDFTSNDPSGSFGLQSSVTMNQNIVANSNFGYCGNKTFLQNVGLDIHEGDLKDVTSFFPVTERRKALTGDTYVPQKKSSNCSQVGLTHSLGSLEPDVNYRTFEFTSQPQHSWSGETAGMQFLQQAQQEENPYLLLEDGYIHRPPPGPQHQIQNDHLQPGPSINTRTTITERDKVSPAEIKTLYTEHRSNQVRKVRPTGHTMDSSCVQAGADIVNPPAFRGMSIITGSSHMKNHSSDPSCSNNSESLQVNISPGSGSFSSLHTDFELCLLQGYGYSENVGFNNIELLDYNPDFITDLPSHLYDGLRFNYDYLRDSMEYPIMDQGIA